MKLGIILLSNIFLLLASCLAQAQTFSVTIPGSFYTARYAPAKNGDYFICGALTNSRLIYCARLSNTGELLWEKIFPVADITPRVDIEATSENGLVIFSRDYNTNGRNSALLTKLDKDGNINWSKRFQVGANLLITPVDIQESPDKEYVLLFDVIEPDLFAIKRPQLAVFSKSGKLISQTGIKPFPVSRGDNYYSGSLTITENGDYIIGARVDYVDYEYASWPKLIRISKDTSIVPTYTSLYILRFYDSWWPGAILEKDGKIFMRGGYSAYKYYFTNNAPVYTSFIQLDTYVSFSENDIAGKVKFNQPSRFLDQKLVNEGVLPFGFREKLGIAKDGSMISFGFSADHLYIHKYNALGQTCPAYETPVIDTSTKLENCSISRGPITKGVDTIATLNNHNLVARDTSIAIVDCREATLVSTKILSQQTTSSHQTAKLYPNPAHDFALVGFSLQAASVVRTQLISIDGRILYATKETLNAGSYERKINLAGISSGIYFVQLMYGDKIDTRKLIKK